MRMTHPLRTRIVATIGLALALSNIGGCRWVTAREMEPYGPGLFGLFYVGDPVPRPAERTVRDSSFYGYQATCWRAWPQPWLGCPPPETEAAPGESEVYPREFGAGRLDPSGTVEPPQGVDPSSQDGMLQPVPDVPAEAAPDAAPSTATPPETIPTPPSDVMPIERPPATNPATNGGILPQTERPLRTPSISEDVRPRSIVDGRRSGSPSVREAVGMDEQGSGLRVVTYIVPEPTPESALLPKRMSARSGSAAQ